VREIATFSNEIQPITLAMILDRSGSLTSRAQQVTAAATSFFDALLPGDRVSLGSLTWDCVPMTDDLPRLRTAVAGPMMVDWGSPIWESVDRAFFAMENEPGRRAILIFSDGLDSATPPAAMPATQGQPCQPAQSATGASVREVAARAERNGVLVYAVGVEVAGRREDSDLRTIARNTGGELFRMEEGESLTPVFERIAEELHSQYLIGFVPTVRDGRSARIEVRTTRRGLQVRARRSFAVEPDVPAPRESPAAADLTLTDADVETAIQDGLAGRTIKATCTAHATGSRGYFDVTLEGPVARIMRAARDARDRREPFALDNVTPRMRAATVDVSAIGRVPVPTEPEAVEATPPIVTRLALRSLGSRPVLLQPVIANRLRLRPGAFEAEFDLANLRALGHEVEVIVHGVPAGRCRLTQKALAQIR
jgi:Ca-activated chloride channel family protein